MISDCVFPGEAPVLPEMAGDVGNAIAYAGL
jgi:hypothetical protein